MYQINLQHEHDWHTQGHRFVAGLDEAGRGAWAGPVVAGAVILPLERTDLLHVLCEVNDSKKLSPKKREALVPLIIDVALTCGVGHASHAEIDAFGIVAATQLAMQRAVMALSPQPRALLLDAIKLPNLHLPSLSLIKGDQRSLSIAAASILAKVLRDRYMIELAQSYPEYGFDRHKGYGTAQHRQMLEQWGATPVHRMSFAPIANLVDVQQTESENA